METQVEVKEIERKVLKETQQDGLMELVMGLCFLAFSMRALHPVFVGTFALAPLLFRPVLNAMRKRFTYPRIGYARLVEDKPADILGSIALVLLIVVAVLVVAFLFFGDVRDFGLWLKWIAVFPGVLMGAMFVSLAFHAGSPRYYLFAVASAGTGVVVSLPRFDPAETGLFLYFLAMGAVLAFGGFVVFLRFLRRYPVPAEEASDANG